MDPSPWGGDGSGDSSGPGRGFLQTPLYSGDLYGVLPRQVPVSGHGPTPEGPLEPPGLTYLPYALRGRPTVPPATTRSTVTPCRTGTPLL